MIVRPSVRTTVGQNWIFAYNEEDEEAANTTSTDVESRDDGDCGDDQDCIHPVSGYMFADTEFPTATASGP